MHRAYDRISVDGQVLPFNGFSFFAAPFAFLSESLDEIYPLFRSFYVRYMVRQFAFSVPMWSIGVVNKNKFMTR